MLPTVERVDEVGQVVLEVEPRSLGAAEPDQLPHGHVTFLTRVASALRLTALRCSA